MTDKQVHLWPQDSHPHTLLQSASCMANTGLVFSPGMLCPQPDYLYCQPGAVPTHARIWHSDMLYGGHRLVKFGSLCQRCLCTTDGTA